MLRHFAFVHESGEDAEKRLELKEQSEKVKLTLVKEKRSFKRFDLVSALAVLGVLAVLAFESFFIFEFYRIDYAKIEPYLPGFLKELFESPPAPVAEPVKMAAQEAVADAPETESIQTNSASALEEEAAPVTNTVPAASDEPESAPADVEPVPVG